MSGLSRLEDDFNGFPVAHLSDQDDLRRLPHRRAQGVRKTWGIAVQLALVNGRAFVVVEKLDRIFDGDDVVILLAVDGVEQNGQRGGFTRTGCSGYEHDSIAKFGDVRQLLGQAQRREFWDS